MKIVLKCEAQVYTGNPPADRSSLPQGGLKSSDRCTNYFSLELQKHLLGITGGEIRLTYDPRVECWWTETVYILPGIVTDSVLKKLVDSTIGQWSDGFGCDCFADYAESNKLLIELFPHESIDAVTIEIDPDFGTKPNVIEGQLSIAAREGRLDVVQSLLESGANIEELSQGSTPLFGAVLSGYKTVALELIRRGAKVSAFNSQGQDALMACALSNRLEDGDATDIAKELLLRGVDPSMARDGYTPLFMATHRKKKMLSELLRSHGATG